MYLTALMCIRAYDYPQSFLETYILMWTDILYITCRYFWYIVINVYCIMLIISILRYIKQN